VVLGVDRLAVLAGVLRYAVRNCPGDGHPVALEP
jgi:hypothetical protein